MQYNLFSLQEESIIGTLDVDNKYLNIKINLANSSWDKYFQAFDFLIDSIREDSNFKISKSKNNLDLNQTNKDFYDCLIQKLILHLQIMPQKVSQI